MYTIGRLARRARVNTDSIRFYERQKLLASATRTDCGYHLYTEDTVRRIAFIKHAQRCGFSLAQVREILDMSSSDPEAIANGYRLAREKKAQIEEDIRALHAMRDALGCLLQNGSDCVDVGALLEENALTALNQERERQRAGAVPRPFGS